MAGPPRLQSSSRLKDMSAKAPCRKARRQKSRKPTSRRLTLMPFASLPTWTRSRKPISSLPSTACMAQGATCWQISSKSAESSMCRFAVRSTRSFPESILSRLSRIGAAAEDGSFVDSHKIFSILLQWVVTRHKDWPGDVARAFNTTRMLDRIAAKHGRTLIECGIGFKYICDLMLERQIVIGGEESGGIGFQRQLPERDGLLNALLLANVMADEGKSLGQLVAALQSEYGPHYYARRDLRIPNDVKEAAIARAGSGETTSLGRHKVLRKENLDGIKFFLDAPIKDKGADAWVLLRSSGTEPLMRIYVEASSPELVQEILEEAVAFVDNKVPAATR